MRKKSEYFILRQKSDFCRGYGGRTEADGLIIKDWYFSRLFDSGEMSMRWYKLSMSYVQPINSLFRFTFYAFESDSIVFKGKVYRIEELMCSSIPAEQKFAALEQYPHLSLSASREMLIARLHGRYLIFAVQLTSAAEDTAKIYEAKLYFRPYSIMHYLPEVYQTEENSFLERYLSIFQNLYEDMERSIEKTYENYTAESAGSDFLRWLASWYCIRTADLWSESQLRYILRNAARIYRNLGTREIIEELCGIYIGERPEIVEYYRTDKQEIVKKYGVSYEKLFIDPYVFTLVIPTVVLSSADMEKLYQIIDSCKPAHMEVNILMIAEHMPRESRIDEGRLTDQDDIGGLIDGIVLGE